MLGGGFFTSQNKVLPGSYINFVSALAAGATLADRGTVAMASKLNWGEDATILELTKETLNNGIYSMLGYSADADEMKDIREVLLHAKKLLLYRLDGNGTKASNTFGSAKYAGTRGNDLSVKITANVDNDTKFDVTSYLGTEVVDVQRGVADATELVDNDFIDWDASSTLALTSGTSMTGGTNSTVTGTQHSAFLTALESEAYNIVCTNASTDSTIQGLYKAYVVRMREEVGIKVQTVLYQFAGNHEGVINCYTSASLIPWLAGAEAGCAINSSLTNVLYDGEYSITAAYTQNQLESGINAGYLMFHKVGNEYRVLKDINSLTEYTETKGEDFKNNQVIRVIDQIGNDVAALFNTRYLGKYQNDATGRVALWSALVDYFNQLKNLRAIEGFDANEDIQVSAGNDRTAVVVSTNIRPICCMEILYMTVYIM